MTGTNSCFLAFFNVAGIVQHARKFEAAKRCPQPVLAKGEVCSSQEDNERKEAKSNSAADGVQSTSRLEDSSTNYQVDRGRRLGHDQYLIAEFPILIGDK